MARLRAYLQLSPGAEVSAREGVRVSGTLRRRARVVAEALFSGPDGAPPAARLDAFEDDLAHFLSHAGAFPRFLIGASLFLTCVVGPTAVRRFTLLASLSPADRCEVLERIEQSKLALPFLAVRALLCLVYYEDPDAQKMIGFDRLCHSGRQRS